MNEKLISEFFKKTPIACCFQKVLLDKNGVPYNYEFIYVNEQFEKLSKMKITEIIGKTFGDIFTTHFKNQDEWNKKIIEASIKKDIFKLESFDEITEKYLKIMEFPINEEYCVIVIYDETEEYYKDKQVEGFFEANIDLLCVSDIYGNFIKVNKEFENILGYDVNELEGISFLTLIHEDDIEPTLNVLNQLKGQNPILTFVNRYKCENGKYKHIEWRAHPKGTVVYSSGRDISKKMEMENKLKTFNFQLTKLAEELKEKNAVLEFIANKDKLTGLYNRHYFDEIIESIMDEADIKNQTISLVLFDLDHFKNVNDIWGHPVGDIVLKTTAEIAGSTIRKSDILFRWGGEEFIILMPKTSVNEAIAVAEEIRKKIEKNIFNEVGHLTCSFGVAARLRYEAFRKWYKKADEAVYRAKEEGRNRVVNFYEENSDIVININLEWTRNYQSGNKTIDLQHYKIMELGSEILSRSIVGMKSKEFEEKLKLLLKHIEDHFVYEGNVLNEINYPDRKEHMEMHSELMQKTLRLKNYYDIGKLTRTDLFTFIFDEVIIGHLIEQDSKFFSYIK